MVVNQAKNNRELEQMLKPALKVAVEYLLDKISDENQYAIMHEVYYGSASAEPGWYERTGEFAKAWETQVHTGSNLEHTVEGRFFYSPYLMNYNSAKRQHGSPPEYYEQDVRPYLAQIIYEGLSGSLFGEGYWTEKRDAWSVLEKRLGKMALRTWMKEGLEKAGFQVKTYRGF